MLEDVSNMWRGLQRWPRTSFSLDTTLGGPARAWRRPWRCGGPSEDVRNKMEVQTDSTSFQFRTPGTARTKMDAKVAYGVRFGRSLYGWKDNFKTLPVALVSSTKSFGVIRNHPRNLTSIICPGAAAPSFVLWALYRVGAHYGHVQGVLHDPRVFINSSCYSIRFWVLLRLFYQEQFRRHVGL